ncbi:hypothetical protein [Hymenobacter cavernae]|uniref:Uncharacterized protein n=1 Tax=Hymenobacter cavernae TaxID=2044852 RepID=A0ABQ1UMZ2_9BACT|nr:hypothetical protein [Hymenobacter cavernae]GGF22386.1 hypothetical protein GCM10011383_37520 [Hymenobacter cavernae]
MLHIIFPELAERLRDKVPALGTIDLDMSQLDYQDQEPIAYPAVFIDLENIAWHDVGQGIQNGQALLRFTVAVEVSEETFSNTGRTDAMERLTIIQEVHKALQHFGNAKLAPMVRTSYRRDRPQHPEAYCVAMGYVTQLYDNDGVPEYETISNLGLKVAKGKRPVTNDEGDFIL